MSVTLPPEHMRPTDAERQLVGGLLREPDAVDVALRFLSGPDDFYWHVHRIVFGVCRDLFHAAKAGGPLDVYHELVRRGVQAELGPNGALWLAEAWEAAPTAANVEYHAKLVRDGALRRKLWHTAQRLLREAELPPTGPVEEQIAQAAENIHELTDVVAGRSTSTVRLRDLLNETLAEVDSRISEPERRLGLTSGFPALDAVIGGFRPGQLIVIAARPSVGKSALLLAIAAAVAKNKCPVFLSSLEMPKLEIGERLLAMGANVRLHNIRTGRLDRGELDRLFESLGPDCYGGAELFVDDTPSMTTARFAATVRTHVRKHDVRLAATDYLQLLEPADKRESRVLQVGRMSRDLKLLARQCNIPVVVPAQLNRAIESRADSKPKLSDVRESGDVEQNADVMIGLYTPDPTADGDALMVNALVMKNRNGRRDVEVPLAYKRSVVRFETA